MTDRVIIASFRTNRVGTKVVNTPAAEAFAKDWVTDQPGSMRDAIRPVLKEKYGMVEQLRCHPRTVRHPGDDTDDDVQDGDPDDIFWDDAVRSDDAQESLAWAMFTWGHEAQLGMLGEEADELSRAVHRLQNGREDDLKQLVEEITDVRVVMEQITHHVTDDALAAELDGALDQLDDKLQAGDLNGD